MKSRSSINRAHTLSACLLLAFFFLSFGLVEEAGAQKTPKASRARVVLSTFKVKPEGGLSYELSVAPCARKDCPVQVRLVEGKRVYSTLNLDWNAGPGDISKAEVDNGFGAGDPLEELAEIPMWDIGSAQEVVSVAARPVGLAPGLRGLLVHQRAGFEHLKRRHYLFVAQGRRLVRAWTGSEGEGPTWSNVGVGDSKDGAQEIRFFKGFSYPSDEEPDSLEITSYRWNARRNSLDELSAAATLPPVFAVVAGAYGSVAEARRAASDNMECLEGFIVLRAEGLSQYAGKIIVAAVTSNERDADRTLKKITGCAPGLDPKVTRLQ
ncbi:MAG TPA: hypothetical protein VE262_15285 [Blastocatellia bacterium]|nr:hypothetical protein [Blastocatellia bacterium]